MSLYFLPQQNLNLVMRRNLDSRASPKAMKPARLKSVTQRNLFGQPRSTIKFGWPIELRCEILKYIETMSTRLNYMRQIKSCY